MGKWVASWRWVASLAAKQARCRHNDNELNDDDEQDVLGLRTCRGHISLADSEPGLVRRFPFHVHYAVEPGRCCRQLVKALQFPLQGEVARGDVDGLRARTQRRIFDAPFTN